MKKLIIAAVMAMGLTTTANAAFETSTKLLCGSTNNYQLTLFASGGVRINRSDKDHTWYIPASEVTTTHAHYTTDYEYTGADQGKWRLVMKLNRYTLKLTASWLKWEYSNFYEKWEWRILRKASDYGSIQCRIHHEPRI